MHFGTGSLKLNICINSDEGVKAIPVIKHYLDEMPALRYLVLVIKAFLSQKGLDLASSGGLGSYATMCLVIHFLQVRFPFVPGGLADPCCVG